MGTCRMRHEQVRQQVTQATTAGIPRPALDARPPARLQEGAVIADPGAALDPSHPARARQGQPKPLGAAVLPRLRPPAQQAHAQREGRRGARPHG